MKNYIIGIVAVLFLLSALFGIYFLRENKTSNDTNEVIPVLEETSTTVIEEVKNPLDINVPAENSEVPETAIKYQITDGSAGYIAQKRFLAQDDLQVTGTSNKIAGEGWFGFQSSTGYLLASFDMNDVKTESSSRDKDVVSRFNPDIVSIELSNQLSFIKENEEFKQPINLTISANGVERDVVFEIVGTINMDSIVAKGSTKILMSEFNITPPSFVGVYTVDDEIELFFDIKAKKTL